MDVTHLTPLELLRAHGAILDELRRREIVRSTNSPISDYAEVLFCRAFGWTREGNSAAGFDATDVAGQRYQIKARRMTDDLGSTLLREPGEQPNNCTVCTLLLGSNQWGRVRGGLTSKEFIGTRLRNKKHRQARHRRQISSFGKIGKFQ